MSQVKKAILVTGANGFVGRAVCMQAVSLGMEVRGVQRGGTVSTCPVQVVQIDELDGATQYAQALAGCDAIVHCAARVHVMTDRGIDSLAEYRRVNVEGTLNLANQAVAAHVRRFIFISSIKVNGESTPRGQPFSISDVPAPQDAYGKSKFEAEQALLVLAKQTGLEVVIIRPPLVYGPGVKANFASMVRWLQSGLPLPLGAINNQRSLVALGNLTDLIMTCLDHPAAKNRTFLVSDGQDVSTTELLRLMAHAMHRPARLLPVPQSMLLLTLRLIGLSGFAQRLCASLQVDIASTRQLLDWTPPLTLEQGLRQVVAGGREAEC